MALREIKIYEPDSEKIQFVQELLKLPHPNSIQVFSYYNTFVYKDMDFNRNVHRYILYKSYELINTPLIKLLIQIYTLLLCQDIAPLE